MIQKPPPLKILETEPSEPSEPYQISTPDPISSSKLLLKQMLEATDRKDQGLESPLDEINPMSLDELVNRIDNGSLRLNQVPPIGQGSDIEKLVQIYQSLLIRANLEIEIGITQRPKGRAKIQEKPVKSIADMLDDEGELKNL